MSNSDSEKLDQLLQDGAVIKGAVADIKDDINSLQKVIYVGNGKPSLIARVEVVEVHLEDLKWWKRAAIAGVFTGLLGLGMAITERLIN